MKRLVSEQILDHVESIVAIELMAAAQGIDFRRQEMGTDAKLGERTSVAYDLIRTKVPFLETDVYLAPLMEAARQLVTGGTIAKATIKLND